MFNISWILQVVLPHGSMAITNNNTNKNITWLVELLLTAIKAKKNYAALKTQVWKYIPQKFTVLSIMPCSI